MSLIQEKVSQAVEILEEKEIDLAVGDSVVFYSDGLVEAHNAKREMFGLPRFSQLVGEHAGGAKMFHWVEAGVGANTLLARLFILVGLSQAGLPSQEDMG